jgi:hypothetical protein
MPDLAQKVDQLEKRLDALESRVRQETLHEVRRVAEADNRWPDSYSGMIDLMDRAGVPKRIRSGRIKEEGSRMTTYVSEYDLKEKC